MKNKTLILLIIITLIFSLRGNSNVKTEEILKEGLPAIQSTPDTILVKYKTQIEPWERESLKALIESANGLQEIRYFSFIDVYLYRTHGDKEKTLEELNKNPNMEYAEPDFIVQVDSTYPNDLYFNDLWGLHNTGQSGGTVDADIDAPEAWDLTTGSSNVVVAVIDTGVDYNHEDLSANMWTNSGEIPNNGLDDDNNGYVDDYYGINAITNSNNPMDDHKHGTHCSGTIAGKGNNGIGVAGVCWTAKIMALKFLNAQGNGAYSDAIQCIEYAINKAAHIMSNSWGGYSFSQSLEDAINAAKDAGILFIAAAGNDTRNTDSTPHYPSAYDCYNIISVAATDRNDNLASFSNYGRISVDVAAPGVAIKSSTPNNNYETLQGTSMAAPHVAGLAALIKSYNSALNWMQIKNRILSGAEQKTSLATKILTGGRINAYDSLTSGDISSYSLNIQSSPSTNAYINVSPNDLNGQGNGYTNFTRIYSPYTAVTLTAPASHGGKVFEYWALEGFMYSNQSSVSIPIDFNHTAVATYQIDLADAVDNNNLTWVTGGDGEGWYGQSIVYYYGDDAAESRDISNSQSNYIQTQVTGPETLNFYWKVSSEANYDYLSFYIDDVRQTRISGAVDWQQEIYSIDSGTHTLKWAYSKDSSISVGSDCGWLDKVEYGAPSQTYTLTIATSTTGGGTGGTTNPSPGNHTYNSGASVAITASPNTDYRFSGWTGNVPSGHENDNPLTITMDSDKSITANFIRQYTLTIATSTTYGTNGGTTNPSAGSQKYDAQTAATITASPNTDYRFTGWTGNVPSGHENDNPLTITMDSDKSITANFIRIIYAPLNFSGKMEYNRSLLQSQYINALTWQANPKNVSPYLSIVKFKIYEVVGQTKTRLAEVNTNTLQYWHRNVLKDRQYTYAICEVNTDGREGDLATVTIQGQGAIKENQDTQAVMTTKSESRKKLDNGNNDISSPDKPIPTTVIRNNNLPLNFAGRKELSPSQSSIILSWQADPNNQSIKKYRIYQEEGARKILLAELSADSGEYIHRNVEKNREYTYALVEVNAKDQEGKPVYTEVK